MENEYSKLYDATYKKVFSKLESEIKDEIIEQYNKYSGFQVVFDLVYKDIVDKIDALYINKSDKFKKVIDWYLVRYDVKRKEAICLIYEDQMYTEFKLIEGIKSNYTYLSFIKEFASNNALVEIKRIWYGGSSIYKLMYEVDYFTDFKICEEYYGHPEHLMQFKKLVYKKRSEEYPHEYKSFEDYLEKDAKFNMTINSLNIPNINKPTDLINKNKNEKEVKESKQVNSFGILERYKEVFLTLYSQLSDDFFDEDDVCFNVFKIVFTEDWGVDEYIFKFKCNNLEISYFIEEFSFAFENFSKANFGKSKLFKTKGGAKLTANQLSKKGKINTKSESKLKYLKMLALDLKNTNLKK